MTITKYAQNAEECFRMAAAAKDQEQETEWLGLAQSWLQLGRWGLHYRGGGSGPAARPDAVSASGVLATQ